jgi:hypothetical protein
MTRETAITTVVAVALVVCVLGVAQGCASECEERGGTLVKTVWRGWECVKVERLR